MHSLIISPSGDLYGSERVLLDFLLTTKNQYYLFIPSKGSLLKEAKKTNHVVFTYNNSTLTSFYLKLFFFIIMHKITKVYINEGGHIKYIKLLARIFFQKFFLVHIRIIEDTKSKRMGILKKNITLITISDFLAKELAANNYNRMVKLNDPYTFSKNFKYNKTVEDNISISVIGRFTKSKGSDHVLLFFKTIDKKIDYRITLNIMGNIDNSPAIINIINELQTLNNIKINTPGFIENPKQIYQASDIVMHFNLNEPLGRIFFEAIDHVVPFIGFKSGGIQEIGSQCGLDNYLIEFNESWEEEMLSKLTYIINNRNKVVADLLSAKEKAINIFSAEKYTNDLEKHII